MTEGGFTLKVRDRVSGSIGQGKDSSLTPSGVGVPGEGGSEPWLVSQSWNLTVWPQAIFCPMGAWAWEVRGKAWKERCSLFHIQSQLLSSTCALPMAEKRSQHSRFAPEQGLGRVHSSTFHASSPQWAERA